jgi:hypothetical protein
MSPNVKPRSVQSDYVNKIFQWRRVYAMQPMTRQEIQQKMDELARKYVETRDKEIPQELYQMARELEKIEKLEKQ